MVFSLRLSLLFICLQCTKYPLKCNISLVTSKDLSHSLNSLGILNCVKFALESTIIVQTIYFKHLYCKILNLFSCIRKKIKIKNQQIKKKKSE